MDPGGKITITPKDNHYEISITDYVLQDDSFPNRIVYDMVTSLLDQKINSDKIIITELTATYGVIRLPLLKLLPKAIANAIGLIPSHIKEKILYAAYSIEHLNLSLSNNLKSYAENLHARMENVIELYSDIVVDDKLYTYDRSTFQITIELNMLNGPMVPPVISPENLTHYVTMGDVYDDVKKFLIDRFRDFDITLLDKPHV